MPNNKILSLIAALVLVAATTVAARRVIRAAPGSNKTGCYIVQLEDDTSHDKFEEITDKILNESIDHHIYEKVEGNVSKIITIRLTEEALNRVRVLDNVIFIEEETYARAAQSVSWHLDRIDQTEPQLDGQYNTECTGENADIYILDTGIRYDHTEFENRALYPGYDAVDSNSRSKQRGADCNGHGTHVASLAAGKTYGVAKKARVYSVRVLDCDGSAPWSYIIDGINYAAEQASQSGRPSIISMSLGGGYSSSADRAVRNVVNNNGIPVVVAAGNENTDACSSSPASTAEAVTVGGTAYGDDVYYYSNGGSCVDILAPGESITAASYTCSSCAVTYSGTSMSTPIVSGAIAVLLETQPDLTPAQIAQHLIDASTKGVIDLGRLPNRIADDTPNRLLYVEKCVADRVEPIAISTSTVTQTTTVTATYTAIETYYNTRTTTQTVTRSHTVTKSSIITKTVEPEGCQITPTSTIFSTSTINASPTVMPDRSEYGLHQDSPANSCSELLGFPGYSSSHYYIASASGTAVLVYCEMDKIIRDNRGLMRVANVNMTDTSQQCPGELELLNTPRRTCRRGKAGSGCSSAIFSTNGISYSKVCGRIRGYQYSTPNAFYPFNKYPSLGLSDTYVDGVSLTNTHANLDRQHIWTFAAALDEVYRAQLPFACPCTYSSQPTTNIDIPDFIGDDYFCETGSRDKYSYRTFYADDPLWDGAGCGENDVCCDRGEYFCKTFSEPATSDIELRLCGNEIRSNEDTPIEIIELYVQ